jgi:cytochrome P450
VFNGGPRACLGQRMAYVEAQSLLSHLLLHFRFKLVAGQTIIPKLGLLLQMKYGMKVLRDDSPAVKHYKDRVAAAGAK